jgi:hypothetical protein
MAASMNLDAVSESRIAIQKMGLDLPTMERFILLTCHLGTHAFQQEYP